MLFGCAKLPFTLLVAVFWSPPSKRCWWAEAAAPPAGTKKPEPTGLGAADEVAVPLATDAARRIISCCPSAEWCGLLLALSLLLPRPTVLPMPRGKCVRMWGLFALVPTTGAVSGLVVEGTEARRAA